MPGGVQGYDRYAYTSNNPINRIDPSGHADCSTITYDAAKKACWASQQAANKPDESKNFLGRHLTVTEQKWIAAFILGETSRFTDSGNYDWIIWGLLNKVSWDTWQNKGYSIYGSLHNEESGVLAQFRAATDEYGTTEAESIQMLNDMVNLYESGDTLDEQGKGGTGGLAKEFAHVLGTVNDIENLWFAYGPNSSVDPTHGGVGHHKEPGGNEGFLSKKEALRVRNSFKYGPQYGRTAASDVYSFNYFDENTGEITPQWRYITMDTPPIWWP